MGDDMTEAHFTQTQLAQIAEVVKRAMHAEFFNVGLLANDEDEVVETRKDFAFMRWLRQAGNRTAQKVGWAVIAALLSGLIYILKLGFDIYVGHK